MESKDYLSELESTITHLEAQQKYDLDKLAKAEKRLEELEGYAEHKEGCHKHSSMMSPPNTRTRKTIKCNCGLDNLLRGE